MRATAASMLIATVVGILLRCAFVTTVAVGMTNAVWFSRNVTTVARMTQVVDVAVDHDENLLYLSYTGCALHRVYTSIGSGLDKVIAGVEGSCGYGDGFGSGAYFYDPNGFALDSSRTAAFIPDQFNNCIRKVNLLTYQVTTIAGATSNGYLDGPAASARFDYPIGVAFNNMTSEGALLFITDFNNGVVRKFALSTMVVSTVGAVAQGVFIAVNRAATTLYVSSNLNVIVRIDVTTGQSTYVAGAYNVAAYADGPAANARLSTPRGVMLIPDETAVVIGDRFNYRVRLLNLTSMMMTTIAGSGTPSSIDGAPLASTFIGFSGMKWHCNATLLTCGALMGTYDTNVPGSIRFLPLSPMVTQSSTPSHLTRVLSISMSSDVSSATTTSTLSHSASNTRSNHASVTAATATHTTTFHFSQTSTFAPSSSATSTLRIATTPTMMDTPSMSGSPCTTATTSREQSTSNTLAASIAMTTLSRSRTIHTITLMQSVTLTSSPSVGTADVTGSCTRELSASSSSSRTNNTTSTLSRWSIASALLSLSSVASNTKRSASATRTSQRSTTKSLQLTTTLSRSTSTTQTPSTSSTMETTAATKSLTRSKSSTQFDCNVFPWETTSVALTHVNTSEITKSMQHLFPRNSSSALLLLMGSTTNKSYAIHQDQNSRQSPPFAFLTSQGVDRIALLQVPSLLFNLTLTSPYQLVYYYVGNVTTVQGTNVSATWSVHPRSGAWHGVAVEAPSVSWVREGIFPVLLYTELNLLVPLMCGDGHAMLTVVLTVPSPGVARLLAAEVHRAAQATLIVALLATGAVSGSALGRILATDGMVLCDADAAGGGGVIDFDFEICVESPDLIEVRSAIVSNLVLVAAVCVLLLLAACLWLAVTSWNLSSHQNFAAAAKTVFLFPSTMLPVLTSTMPSTVVSMTFLIARVSSSSCIGVDALLIVLGMLLIVVPVAALLYLAVFGAAYLSRVAEPIEKRGAGTEKPLEAVKLLFRRVTRRSFKWRSAFAARGAESLRPAWVVLLEYRVLWYAAVDTLFLIAVSSLAVVGGLDVTNEALCRGCSAAVVALLGAQVGVLCVWRPYTTLFSLVYNVVTTALTCVSVAAQLAFVLTSFTSTSGLWLVDASAVCNLLVLGLSVVKMLLDAWELWSAVKRRFADWQTRGIVVDSKSSDSTRMKLSLMTSNFLNDEGGSNDDVVATAEKLLADDFIVVAPMAIERCISPMVFGEGNYAHDFDLVFWDDGGLAIGTSHAEEQNEILTTVVQESAARIVC